jgi:glycosyltransferase involved in cell wall biosynthesis
MIYGDLCSIAEPLITVVTPSLNGARFLRETIESTAAQTFRSFEHIIIDGASTDGTIEILRDYPHLKWISEKDNHVNEAYRKGFDMARGKYVIQCCVSDGFLDRRWFGKCVKIVDNDPDVALVWGLPQYMSENGDLLNVSYADFLTDAPPQKQEFLAFWLATGFVFPEGNYCVRAHIIKSLFPGNDAPDYFRTMPHLGFMYELMTRGYLAYFVPAVVNYGRIHVEQRGRRLLKEEAPAAAAYFKRVKEYRHLLLKGKVTHSFRNGRGEVIGVLDRSRIQCLRWQIWRHRILRSRLLRRDPYTLMFKLWERIAKHRPRMRRSGVEARVR